VIYGVLIAIGGWLMVRELHTGRARSGSEEDQAGPHAPAGRPDLVLAY